MIEHLIQLLTKPEIEWSLLDKVVLTVVIFFSVIVIYIIWRLIVLIQHKIQDRRKDRWKK